jgi:hypothetical protein
VERVKPIPRETAQIKLSRMVVDAKLQTTTQAIDYLIRRFMRVPPGDDARARLIAFLNNDLGTADIAVAQTYMEQSLRMTLHLIMSQPEYQLA